MHYDTVDMRDIIRRHNGHWFDPDTMHFFRSRLPKTGTMLDNGIALFVSSERPPCGSRRYTIRIQGEEGNVDTLRLWDDPFCRYASRREATADMLAYAKEQ